MSHYRSLDNLNLVNTEDYDDFEIFELESARTVVLFHQVSHLDPKGTELILKF